jgi:glucose-6-phosphate isomerase
MIKTRHIQVNEAIGQLRLDEAWGRLLNRKEVGFPRLVERHEDWSAIAARAAEVGQPERVIVVGIGGSSLGIQVIAEAFSLHTKCQLFFLESPDPQVWRNLMRLPDWREAHLVVISKSGNTLETLALTEKLAASAPEMFNTRQVTVIASPGQGPLQTWAKEKGFPVLWIPEDIGGRFSVLTAVGMFPAALMGLDLGAFREGAAWALKQTSLSGQICHAILESWSSECWTTQLWAYAESLKVFGEWWTQLWSESLGKKFARTGAPARRVSAPVACRGPRDQHSLVQQLMEGPRDKFVFVLRVEDVEDQDELFQPSLFPTMPFASRPVSLGRILASEAEAFEHSLSEVGIPMGTLQLTTINEKSIGALFMLWQMVIGQLGEVLEINVFDQPGVERGKKYAQQILAQLR